MLFAYLFKIIKRKPYFDIILFIMNFKKLRKFEIGKYNYKNDKCVKFNIQNKPRNVFQNVEIIKYALSYKKNDTTKHMIFPKLYKFKFYN